MRQEMRTCFLGESFDIIFLFIFKLHYQEYVKPFALWILKKISWLALASCEAKYLNMIPKIGKHLGRSPGSTLLFRTNERVSFRLYPGQTNLRSTKAAKNRLSLSNCLVSLK